MKYILSLFVELSLVFFTHSAYSQVDRGGVPRSFQSQNILKSHLQLIEVTPPDIHLIQNEDIEDAGLEKSYRVGIEVPVTISSSNSGQWDNLQGGGRIWRVSVSCKGAQGLGLNFSKILLPQGADIFVYTADHKNTIGAITSAEINGNNKFTTRPIATEVLTLEYFEPAYAKEQATIEISGISYIYRGFESPVVRASQYTSTITCEVNVNCEEGQSWQNQKNGVVKIYAKVGSNYFYCSGSIINNTSQDFSGLLLTASHCSKDFAGVYASSDDYSQWVFYFNYETPGCTAAGADELTVVGAQVLATSQTPTEIGSDFLLLKLLSDIPAKYNPYYCGWDIGNSNLTSGVCIHHPNGAVKKISTYNSPLGSGTWGSIPNTHWTVHWVPTANGYGVTEGGSSGSPLFDDEGLIIGSLTGGYSDCDTPDGEDMFGKISFSWISNGADSAQQLKPWLDPGNTGIIKMPGSFNEKLAVADFSANRYVTPVGGSIDFQDLSSGIPDKWHWYFQGAKPSESTDQNPSGIRFEHYGEMNVKLVVSNAYNADSIVKEKFINVKAILSPNPTSTGVVNILSDINTENDMIIDVFDSQGKIAQHFQYAAATSYIYTIKLPDSGNIFIIRIIQGDQVQTHKVLVVNRLNQ